MPLSRHCRFLFVLTLVLLLSACASRDGLRIDRSVTAQGHSSRVQFIVLHYTAADLARSVKLLSEGQVSSHYLVTDDEPARILQLVDENRAAWHAGQSQWRGRAWLNASSIGIEIVNPGFTVGADGARTWYPYSESQIEAVIALVRDIAARHEVAPENIVAHSDIAPLRKQDPGPLFPWDRLAAAGLGRWYDEAAFSAWRFRFQTEGVPDVAWFQQELARVGYEVPRHGMLDEPTRTVIAAFQMRYRPQDHSGTPDLDTAALLAAIR